MADHFTPSCLLILTGSSTGFSDHAIKALIYDRIRKPSKLKDPDMKPNATYNDVILESRKSREHALFANPLNWFSLAGLFPLLEGANVLSDNSTDAIYLHHLPHGTRVLFVVREQEVRLRVERGDGIMNENLSEERFLRQDTETDPDLIDIGPYTMAVINRNGMPYLRVWDVDSDALKAFSGLKYFPVNPQFCVEAVYEEFDSPHILGYQDVIGGRHTSSFPGQVHFQLQGQSLSLVAEEMEDELLFNFTDLTRADATYPGGRRLMTSKPADRHLHLDFNLAINWPCAYTPYATCPLPPAENHLPIRIEAGEKRYHD